MPADPRVRLSCTRPAPATSAAALNDALRHATGSHVAVALTIPEAVAIAQAIGDLAHHLAAHRRADIVLAADPPGCADMADRIIAGGPGARPLALARDALAAVGCFRDRYDSAAQYDALLRMTAAGGRTAIVAMSPPARGPEPPAAAEAGRLALQEHLRRTAGPLATVEPGLQAGTFRRRSRLAHTPKATVIVPANGAWNGVDMPAVTTVRLGGSFLASGAGLDTEPLILLDGRVASAAPDAIDALVDMLEQQEIGAIGARVLHADTTIHHAGLMLSADGALTSPGHGRADHPAALITHNPDAVGSVLAIRRTVFLQANGMDPSLAAAAGVTFDLLAADLCLRLRQLGLRTAYTPFALFVRAPSATRPEADLPSDAHRLFRDRWAR